MPSLLLRCLRPCLRLPAFKKTSNHRRGGAIESSEKPPSAPFSGLQQEMAASVAPVHFSTAQFVVPHPQNTAPVPWPISILSVLLASKVPASLLSASRQGSLWVLHASSLASQCATRRQCLNKGTA
ncbi:hypothetical protein GOODEAATRI_007128 [Goodea atripinnis]|uniref:Uncharacterized protein n=1 Tax=Goodea atripinnis TaxID=208336 RepID=A0ABV0NII1_9TELE